MIIIEDDAGKVARGTRIVLGPNFTLTEDATGVPKLEINVGETGVSSVTGTTNRLTATPTTGAVVIDIDSAYVGQASITTVGALGTGSIVSGFGNIDIGSNTLDCGALTVAGDLIVSDGSGVIVGHTVKINFGATPEFQVLGTATPDSSMGFARFENNASGPDVRFLKSRGATIGANVIVQNNDTIGRFRFQAADGGDFNTPAAEISAQIDGTPGLNDMPGRLLFRTTPSGASSVVTRLIIHAAGNSDFQGNAVSMGAFTAASGVFTTPLPTASTVAKVISVTAGTGLDSSGGATPDITIDLNELNDTVGILNANDHLVAVNGTATVRQHISAIPLGIFNNDQGWQPGTVTAVNAGTGISSTGGTTPSIATIANQSHVTAVGALNAGSITSGFGNINIGGSALTAGPITVGNIVSTSTNTLVRNVTNSTMSLSGGSTVALGANIILRGESATNALDIDFRASAVVKLRWDNSVPEWNYQGLNVNNILTLTATNLGGTLTTAVQPNITTLAGVTTMTALVTVGALGAGSITSGFGNIDIGSSDLTAGNIIASDLKLTSTNGVFRNIATSTMSLSGGTSVALGANIVLRGESATNALDIDFRASAVVKLRWDNSVPEWNYQGLNVNNIGTCTATTFSGSGASLTSLPAANLTGTVASARLSGGYTGITGLGTIIGTLQSGAFQGDGDLLTSLRSSQLTGTIVSARLSGSYTGITSVGTLGSLIVTARITCNGQMGSSQNSIGNSGTSFTYNCNDANSQTVLNTGLATVSVTNAVSGFVYVLKVAAGSGAQSGWNWPSNFRWTGGTKPVMTTVLARDDIITFYQDSGNSEVIAVASLNHF